MAIYPFPSIQAPLRSFLMRYSAISLFTQGSLALGALATAGPMLQRVMNHGYSSLLSSRLLSRLTAGYLLWEVATVVHQLSQTRIGFSEGQLRDRGIGASGPLPPRASPTGGGRDEPFFQPDYLSRSPARDPSGSATGGWGYPSGAGASLHSLSEFRSDFEAHEGFSGPLPSGAGARTSFAFYEEGEAPAILAGGPRTPRHFSFQPQSILTERQLLLKAPVLRFVVIPGLRKASSVASAIKHVVPYVAKKGCRVAAIGCLFISALTGRLGHYFNDKAGIPRQ